MGSPYSGLPERAFWSSGVAARAPLDPGDLYRPRFPISRDSRITTAGSCFAQHVGRVLRLSGLDVVDTERLPDTVSDAVAQRYGYRLFSARYGNIYTARQLLQLMREANGKFTPAQPVWLKGDRYFDALRPSVEPDGLASAELVLAHRKSHLQSTREAFAAADVFVFTFGLTETWLHTASGTCYPTAPGTIAGSFDAREFHFHNFDAIEVLEDFEAFRLELRKLNPRVRFLITTSPVPLTATASGSHVEVATCYSKSVLRAVCGTLVARHGDIDYFPSFELITSQNARGAYFEANQRSVSANGVSAAMGLFLRTHGLEAKPASLPPKTAKAARGGRGNEEDIVCEEALLEAFAE